MVMYYKPIIIFFTTIVHLKVSSYRGHLYGSWLPHIYILLRRENIQGFMTKLGAWWWGDKGGWKEGLGSKGKGGEFEGM